MLVGGGLMVATGPLLLAIALLSRGGDCDNNSIPDENELCSSPARTYGLAIGGVLLVAGGIPLIIIGGEKVPATPTASASISPWLGPDVAGFKLQLDL
jgi:hypothetical protein